MLKSRPRVQCSASTNSTCRISAEKFITRLLRNIAHALNEWCHSSNPFQRLNVSGWIVIVGLL